MQKWNAVLWRVVFWNRPHFNKCGLLWEPEIEYSVQEVLAETVFSQKEPIDVDSTVDQ